MGDGKVSATRSMLLLRINLCALAVVLGLAVSLRGRETPVSGGGGDYSLHWRLGDKRWDTAGEQTKRQGTVKVRRGSLFKRRAARIDRAMGVTNTTAQNSGRHSLRSRGGPLKSRLWKRGSGFETKVVQKKRFKLIRNEEFASRGSSELSLQKLNEFAFRRTHSSQSGIPVKRAGKYPDQQKSD